MYFFEFRVCPRTAFSMESIGFCTDTTHTYEGMEWNRFLRKQTNATYSISHVPHGGKRSFVRSAHIHRKQRQHYRPMHVCWWHECGRNYHYIMLWRFGYHFLSRFICSHVCVRALPVFPGSTKIILHGTRCGCSIWLNIFTKSTSFLCASQWTATIFPKSLLSHSYAAAECLQLNVWEAICIDHRIFEIEKDNFVQPKPSQWGRGVSMGDGGS